MAAATTRLNRRSDETSIVTRNERNRSVKNEEVIVISITSFDQQHSIEEPTMAWSLTSIQPKQTLLTTLMSQKSHPEKTMEGHGASKGMYIDNSCLGLECEPDNNSI